VGDVALYFSGLVVLLLLSAFFSGSEAALFSLSRSQLRALRDASPGGRAAAHLLAHPRPLLITVLVGNLAVNVLATSTATALAIDAFGARGLGLAFAAMSLIIMVLTEVLPKALGMHWAPRVAPVVALPLSIIHVLFLPLRAPLSRFSDFVIDALRGRIGSARRSYAWDELLTAVRLGRREGKIGPFEYEILSHVLEFRQKVVKEIMTPSIHVVSTSIRTHRDELLSLFASSGRSRVPIYGDSPDDVVGILHVKDLVDPLAARNEEDLRARLREAFFIPETAPIAELYAELQRRKLHVAIALDEHGSFAGVVTTEDILEQMIGEIRDARDTKTQPFQRLDERRIVVQGTMEIDHFNEVFDTEIRDDEHETVAGYVLGRLGRVPREGETVVADGLRFHVISAQPNRIRKLRVEKP
jgi:CBS domain containing-hemolysin-like protein